MRLHKEGTLTHFGPAAPAAKRRAGQRRGLFLKWLRKTHGWLGLWGAILGLMFGVTGILQNHRAVLKIPSQPPMVTDVQLTVPESVPKDIKSISVWLQQELGLSKPFNRVTRNAPQTVTFGERKMAQSERFQLMSRSPTEVVQAEYFPENGSISAKRSKPGLMGIIENLHRANGVGVAWVLLSDSMGGCLIILSLTGVLLWTELERRKLIGACIFFVSIATLIGVVAATI